MKSLYRFTIIFLISGFIGIPFSANGESAVDLRKKQLEDHILKYLEEKAPATCAKYESIQSKTCLALIEASARATAGVSLDKEVLKQALKDDINDPAFLNSVLSKALDGDVPIGLEFVSLDSKVSNQTVLGLTYDIDYDSNITKINESKNWRKQTIVGFAASGTVTSDKNKNPENFLASKLSLYRSYTTNIPQQSEDFADKLVDLSVDAAPKCAGPGGKDKVACKQAKKAVYDLLDTTSEILSAYQRYELGLNVGYETDQSFDAEQSTFGFFLFGQYEDWGTHSWLGDLRITPAIHLGIDQVEPNSETPRALAGDDSSYYRFSGELSIWMPVGTYFNKDLTFTVNYRYYEELSPSAIVTSNNLDTYNRRTISLATPTGLFASYSSGRLPFNVQNDNVVKLGWKTYF